MYYFSKLYKIGKNGLIGMGGLAGIGSIVYGILLGQIPGLILIIGGSFWVIQTGIVLYDNSTLLSTIRTQIKNFESSIKENNRMKKIIEDETKDKDRRLLEIDILRAKIVGLNGKIEDLVSLATEYKKRVDTLNAENLDLKSEVDNLVSLRNSFNSEKDNLLSLLEESKAYAKDIQNDRCTVEIEECKKQIAYLTKLYEDSHEILYNMSELTQNMSLGEGIVRIGELEGKTQGKEVGYLPRLMGLGLTYPGKLANLANLANLSKLAKLTGLFAKNEDNDNNNDNDNSNDNNNDNSNIATSKNYNYPYDRYADHNLETLLNMKDPSTKND